MAPEEYTDPRTLANLYWLVCIPIRGAAAALALIVGIRAPRLLPVVGIVSTSVTFTFVFNVYQVHAGVKTKGGFGGYMWWNGLRPMHAVLWGVAAVASFSGQWWAGIPIVADTTVGIVTGVGRECFLASRGR